MRKLFKITPLMVVALFNTSPGHAQEAAPDYFPGAPTGRLFLTIEMQGSGRRDLPNKVEWFRISASRKLELELAMVMPMKGSIPSVKIRGVDKDNAPLPPGLAEMQRAIEPCKGDEACQKRAAIAFSQRMMANPQAFGMAQQDNPRYENWIVDRRDACAKGTVIVEDQGDGVSIDPPSPARPYKFRRSGRLELDAKNDTLMDKVCEADIAVDKETGLVSLRLSGLQIPVPVQLSGQAFTSEKSVLFVEGQRKLEILDQAVDPNAKSWSSQSRIEKAGSVSHNSGQTVAPMTASLTWRFVRN